MKIQKDYIAEDGTRTTIMPIGNGNPDLTLKLKERLGDSKVYMLRNNNWKLNNLTSVTTFLYGIAEKDFILFNAYDALEEGMEMVGYGEGKKHDEWYDYFVYDGRVKEFTINPHFVMSRGLIYARRKKDMKQAKLIVEEGKRYVRRDGKIPDPIEWNPDLHQSNVGYIFRLKCPTKGVYMTYTKNGKYFEGGAISEFDLIEEYVPSTNNVSTTTININGYDVPEPVKEPLEDGQLYHTASFLSNDGAPYVETWCNDTIDNQYLNDGLIHLTQENAEIHIKALKSFTKASDNTEGSKAAEKGTWIVVYTNVEDSDSEDRYKEDFGDGYSVFIDDYDKALAEYEQLLEKENTISASLTKVELSTDYE